MSMIVVQTTAKTIHFILFVCRNNLAIHTTEIGHLFFSQEMICSKDKEKLSSIFISEINLHEFNKKKRLSFIFLLICGLVQFYCQHKQPNDFLWFSSKQYKTILRSNYSKQDDASHRK